MDWLKRQKFDNEVDQITFTEYLNEVTRLMDAIVLLDARIEAFSKEECYEEAVGKLRCFAGIDTHVAMVRVERDDMVNAMDMEWFKELESEDTPGKNLRFYRKLIGMTQPELAKKLGTSKQFISDMENGRKPISKKTAKELAAVFDVSVARFV